MNIKTFLASWLHKKLLNNHVEITRCATNDPPLYQEEKYYIGKKDAYKEIIAYLEMQVHCAHCNKKIDDHRYSPINLLEDSPMNYAVNCLGLNNYDLLCFVCVNKVYDACDRESLQWDRE